MPDKPHVNDASFFHLPGHGIVALSGRDAGAFAQAQCMNDVAALAPGHWHWNGWLTPKGRLIALFALIKRDDETLWLLLPDMPAAEIAAQLQRFVFRSKVAIAMRDDLAVSGALRASLLASGAHCVETAEGGIELDMAGDGGARTLRIGPARATADDDALAMWAAADLRHGLPRLEASQSDRWTPQQLSLDRLEAYSVKKGCYPGQEIVARTHFLGQAKRGLALFEADALLTPGVELRDGDSRLGTVVSVAVRDAQSLALAVVPAAHAVETAMAGDVVLTRLPLMGQLAR